MKLARRNVYSAGSLDPTTFVYTMAWTGPSLVDDGWSCTSVKPDGGVTSRGWATTSSAARSRSPGRQPSGSATVALSPVVSMDRKPPSLNV